jgi:aminotransferase
VSGTGRTGAELEHLLLNEGGVSVLAGTAFGHSGVDYVRISYANSQEKISEALRRIEAVVAAVAEPRRSSVPAAASRS